MPLHNKKSIKKRFIYWLFIVFSLAIITFSAVFIIRNINIIENNLNKQADHLLLLSKKSLSIALWQYNDEYVNDYIDSLFHYNYIIFAKVSDRKRVIKSKVRKNINANSFDHKNFNSDMFIFRESKIVYQKYEIGKITIVITKELIDSQIKKIVTSTIILIIFIFSIITITIYFLFRNYIYNPINKLELSANIISEGDLNAKIDIENDDEIGRLAKTFRQMMINLKKITASRDELNFEIKEREKAEAELKQEKERYINLYIKTPALLYSIDRTEKIINVSDYWLKYMGYEKSEVIGYKSTKFLTDESCKYAKEKVLPEFFKNGFCNNISYQYKKKNGEIIDILLSAASEKDNDGNFIYSLAIMNDITEKLRYEKELHVAKENAELANQAKSQFLANMSHEIRTPINAMLGFSEMLKDQNFGTLNNIQTEYLNNIMESSKRLLFLINDILDLSRVEAGKIKISKTVFNIENLLKQMQTNYSILLSKKSLNFKFFTHRISQNTLLEMNIELSKY